MKQKQGGNEEMDYLRDVLQPLGRIRLRRMFGGYGIYAGELFFALVIGGQLYFKTDALTRPQFEAAGLEEWVYEKEGKPVHMNYFRPPEAIFDEEDELLLWGRLALAAALRTRRPVKKPATEKPPARKSAAGKNTAGNGVAEKVERKAVVNNVRAAGKAGGRTGSGTPHE